MKAQNHKATRNLEKMAKKALPMGLDEEKVAATAEQKRYAVTANG